MISFLIDFIMAVILGSLLTGMIQFHTGFLTNKRFKIWKYDFHISGEKGKSLGYRVWREDL